MKKFLKRLSVVVIAIVLCFLFANVFADDKPEVVKYTDGGISSVLYSDGKLYIWDSINIIIPNVVDYSEKSYGDIAFLDVEKNLKVVHKIDKWNLETQKTEYFFETTDVLKINVKKVLYNKFLTEDNKLYTYDYNEYSEDENYTETLIAENVKEFSFYQGAYLILDFDNNLYAYGTNLFGKKINDGNDILDKPLLIAENIKEFSIDNGSSYSDSHYHYNSMDKRFIGSYYLTNDGELYIMSNSLPYPKKVVDGVDTYLYNNYYIKDGKSYALRIDINDDEISSESIFLFDEKLLQASVYYFDGYVYYLTDKGNFYAGNNVYSGSLYKYELKLLKNNVKEMYYQNGTTYCLDNDGVLFNYKMVYDNEGNRNHVSEEVIHNVKKIVDVDTLIMEDETIYTYGINTNYDMCNFNSKEALTYNNFSIIKGLPNVPQELNISQIVLNNKGRVDFSVGENFDFYSYVYPYNADDREVIWESSDETVATVDSKGTLKFVKPGKTTIKVKSKTTSHFDEVEITVHPSNEGIEILGDKEITVNTNQYTLLKAKVMPEGVLEQELVWTNDAGVDENDYKIINFYGPGDRWHDDEVLAESYDEMVFSVTRPGKYIITVTTEDGKYSDSITVNVIRAVTSISIRPNVDSYLGNTLYIYMSESKELDLNIKVYPEDAADKEVVYTSSDENIATVDENGKVIAKKAGKVKITVKAKNYDVSSYYNILIFGNDITTKIGDVDGDGLVDILDLVKLRRHIAGLEAIE